jgi:hypothetical protein
LTGLFRDASDAGKFKIFTGLVDEPTNVVNTTGTGYTVATLVANVDGNLAGTANAANILSTARTIAASGDAAWSVSFDGSANVTSALTLANTGVTATTYGTSTAVPTIAVDSKGRITSASNTNITFPVTTVNGFSGTVVLTTSDVAEGTNQYFTTARAQASITGGASSVVTANLTASRALVSDGSGKIAASATTTTTEIGYLAGVTSAIQTQLNGKLNLTGGTLTGGLIGTTGSFSSSGSGDTFTIGHTSGSGIALNITKSGNGEGLYINKTSGSGNALTVIGSTSLGALSGTSASFSSTLTASNSFNLNAAANYAVINTDAPSGVNFVFKQSGVVKHEIFTNSTQFAIYNTTTSSVALGIANSNAAATFATNIGWGGVNPTGSAGTSNTLESINGAQIAARIVVPQLYLSSNVSGSPFSPTRAVEGYAAQLSLDAFGGTMSLNRAVSGSAGSAITWINNLGFDNNGSATFSNNITAQNDSAFYRLKRTSGSDIGYITDSTTWGDSGTDFTIGASSSNIRFYTNNSVTEKMRLNNTGILLIGTTNAFSVGITATPNGQIGTTTTGLENIQFWNQATSGNNLFQTFYTEGGGGVFRGSIDYNRGAGLLRFNTTSDANLKNIIGDSDKQKSIDILNSTKIREYSWKDDNTNKSQIGVIAQELYETYKGAVSKGSDDELFGTEEYKTWGVDKTAFTFHLIAGWQKHEEIINDLQAQIEELKALIAAK